MSLLQGVSLRDPNVSNRIKTHMLLTKNLNVHVSLTCNFYVPNLSVRLREEPFVQSFVCRVPWTKDWIIWNCLFVILTSYAAAWLLLSFLRSVEEVKNKCSRRQCSSGRLLPFRHIYFQYFLYLLKRRLGIYKPFWQGERIRSIDAIDNEREKIAKCKESIKWTLV